MQCEGKHEYQLNDGIPKKSFRVDKRAAKLFTNAGPIPMSSVRHLGPAGRPSRTKASLEDGPDAH